MSAKKNRNYGAVSRFEETKYSESSRLLQESAKAAQETEEIGTHLLHIGLFPLF